MSCRRYSQTRCRRRYASGSPRRSHGSWRLRGDGPTRSRNSARSPTPSEPAFSSIACTGGSPALLSCNFHRMSLRFSRYGIYLYPLYPLTLVCLIDAGRLYRERAMIWERERAGMRNFCGTALSLVFGLILELFAIYYDIGWFSNVWNF